MITAINKCILHCYSTLLNYPVVYALSVTLSGSHRLHNNTTNLYHCPEARGQKKETSRGMSDQSQTAAEAGEVTHSSDTSPQSLPVHTPQHNTLFTTKVGTCLRVCVLVCPSSAGLLGLVKNSHGGAEDLELNLSKTHNKKSCCVL